MSKLIAKHGLTYRIWVQPVFDSYSGDSSSLIQRVSDLYMHDLLYCYHSQNQPFNIISAGPTIMSTQLDFKWEKTHNLTPLIRGSIPKQRGPLVASTEQLSNIMRIDLKPSPYLALEKIKWKIVDKELRDNCQKLQPMLQKGAGFNYIYSKWHDYLT